MRRTAGVFDVSHMCPIDLKGTRVRQFLQTLLANDVAKLKVSGKALYSCMLNEAGGVLDDLIVYFLDESWFRLVVNAERYYRAVFRGGIASWNLRDTHMAETLQELIAQLERTSGPMVRDSVSVPRSFSVAER